MKWIAYLTVPPIIGIIILAATAKIGPERSYNFLKWEHYTGSALAWIAAWLGLSCFGILIYEGNKHDDSVESGVGLFFWFILVGLVIGSFAAIEIDRLADDQMTQVIAEADAYAEQERLQQELLQFTAMIEATINYPVSEVSRDTAYVEVRPDCQVHYDIVETADGPRLQIRQEGVVRTFDLEDDLFVPALCE